MTAVGNFVAGKIGEATGGHGGEMTKDKFLEIYSLFGWLTIGIGVGVLLLSPIVKRWMHLDTLKDEELGGRAELAENQGTGMFPQGETAPVRPKEA
jgi:POT family proton-dependent oligopeptide transporter